MTDYKLVPVEMALPCPFCGSSNIGNKYIETYSTDSSYDTFGCKDCGARFEDGCQDDWNRRAAPAVQGEPVGEVRFELGAPSSIFAELYSNSLPSLAPGTKLYTAPQTAPAVHGEPSLVAWVLYDATADQKYIKMHSDGSLAIFDSEAAARRAKFLHPGTDYKRCEYYSVPQPANCAGCEGKPEPENTPCAVCGLHLVPPAPEETLSVADYEEVLDDHRLARELDVLLNGEEGAAHQASLADLVAQLRTVVRNTGKPVLAAPDVAGLVEALETALFGTPLDDVSNRDNDDIWCLCYPHLPERASDALRDHLARIETALAAHLKQGGDS